MKNKHAFTLIELLAVIIILFAVLAIAVPKVLYVIKDSKKKAFIDTTNGLYETLLIGISDDEMKTKDLSGTYTIVDGKVVEDNNFDFVGKIPSNGIFTIDEDGSIELAVYNKEWCVVRRAGETEYIANEYDGKCNVITYTDESCFTFNSGTETITDYNSSCSKDVVIPKSIGGVTVKILGDGSFSGAHLTSVVIPKTITSIGEYAFYTNELTKLVMPDSVTSVGGSAFEDNFLTNVKLSNNLTNIEWCSFYQNQIESLTIPANVKTIGNAAFGENNLTTLVIPSGVTTIGESTFELNQLTSLTLPNTLTSIGWGAFANNVLTDLTIPGSVTTIGDYAFQTNNLMSVNFSEGVQHIGASAFRYNKLATVTIPNSMISIGGGAFVYNNMTFLDLGDGVKEIYSSAFANNDLTSVTIPSSVNLLKGGSFSDNKVTGDAAFIHNRNGDGSVNMKSLNCYAGSDLSIVIPSGIEIIGVGSFQGTLITSVTLPATLTTIENYAFSNSKLTTITIPKSVTTIGDTSFGCSSVLNKVIFETGTSIVANGIARYAFSYSTALRSIVYPGSIPQDWNAAFTGDAGALFTTGTFTPSGYSSVVISAS